MFLIILFDANGKHEPDTLGPFVTYEEAQRYAWVANLYCSIVEEGYIVPPTPSQRFQGVNHKRARKPRR